MYVKLGKQASAFYDPATGLSLVAGQMVEIQDDAPEVSADIRIALDNKHLVKVENEEEIAAYKAGEPFESEDEEIDEEEYEEHKKSQMGHDDDDDGDDYTMEDEEFDAENAENYTVAKLRAYLIDTYDWDEEELKEINSAKKAWLVEKVKELE